MLLPVKTLLAVGSQKWCFSLHYSSGASWQERAWGSQIFLAFFLVVSSSYVIQMSGGAFLPFESFKNISMNFSIPCPVDIQIKLGISEGR